MCEPRGHKDMVGALLVEPISKEADIGVIYMDANRWINMCGHATIGVSMTLVNENIVKVVEPETKCQGLFSTPTIHCMKKATVDFSTMAPKSFFIHF